MKKGAPVFLVIMFIAFLGMEKADGWLVAPFFSVAEDIPAPTDDGGLGVLLGIGLNIPFLFNGKRIGNDGSYFRTTISLMVEPVISAEYNFSSDLLRIRTGAHFGRFHANLISIKYYAGVSGAFIKDFVNDAFAFGISPEIGFEFFLFLIGFRVQAQYDFYTTENYNRFVFTFSISVFAPVSALL